jgi:hypothetical protein
MMDRDSSALSTARFAGCLRAVPLLQTLMVGSNTPHSALLHGVHSTTEGHLGVNLLYRGWVCSEGAVGASFLSVVVNAPLVTQCRWE